MNSMIRAIEELESLEFIMDSHLQLDMILQSLPESFGQTIANFHMNNIKCTIVELLNILVIAQKALQGSNKGKEVALIVTSSGTKMKEGEDVGAHVNSMIRAMEELKSLDFIMDFHL